MIPLPSLRTERLVLRPFESEDAIALSNLVSDPDIAKTPMSPEAAEVWIEALPSLWNQRVAVVLAVEAQGRLIGAVQLVLQPHDASAELGFWIGREHWGHGYATEAVRALLAWCHEAGVRRVHAVHEPDNPASGRVMAGAGMLEGPTQESGAVSYQYLVSGLTQ